MPNLETRPFCFLHHDTPFLTLLHLLSHPHPHFPSHIHHPITSYHPITPLNPHRRFIITVVSTAAQNSMTFFMGRQGGIELDDGRGDSHGEICCGGCCDGWWRRCGGHPIHNVTWVWRSGLRRGCVLKLGRGAVRAWAERHRHTRLLQLTLSAWFNHTQRLHSSSRA